MLSCFCSLSIELSLDEELVMMIVSWRIRFVFGIDGNYCNQLLLLGRNSEFVDLFRA